MVPPEERRRMYVATPTSWEKNRPCRVLFVPSCPFLAYEVNAMVGMDEEGRTSRIRGVFIRVAAACHCDMVIVQFLERAWPWFSERLETMPDFDPQMIECGRCGLLHYLLR